MQELLKIRWLPFATGAITNIALFASLHSTHRASHIALPIVYTSYAALAVALYSVLKKRQAKPLEERVLSFLLGFAICSIALLTLSKFG